MIDKILQLEHAVQWEGYPGTCYFKIRVSDSDSYEINIQWALRPRLNVTHTSTTVFNHNFYTRETPLLEEIITHKQYNQLHKWKKEVIEKRMNKQTLEQKEREKKLLAVLEEALDKLIEEKNKK